MKDRFEYKLLRSVEGVFGDNELGIKIMIGGSIPNDIEPANIAAYKAINDLKVALLGQVIKETPSKMENAEKEKNDLIACFPEPIYVEEIPNGYCSDYCCKHLPWFVVTTSLGRITIGWRKRVINIDWTDSIITKCGDELFKGEETDKGYRYIHAWSVEKAEEYIHKLLGLS